MQADNFTDELQARGATQPGLGLSLGRALHAVHGAFDAREGDHGYRGIPPS